MYVCMYNVMVHYKKTHQSLFSLIFHSNNKIHFTNLVQFLFQVKLSSFSLLDAIAVSRQLVFSLSIYAVNIYEIF